MRLKAGDRAGESDAVAKAISEFPETFGLVGFPGKTFRISQSASYVSDYPVANTVQLYTQVKRGDLWFDFAKGTPSELRSQITEGQ